MMPSWPQMLILIAIIVILFGTKKLSRFGTDLGEAIKNFKKSIKDEQNSESLEKIDTKKENQED